MTPITRIAIFDFDGTLFRSPPKPEWYTDPRMWWSETMSLNPPCVPSDPDDSWWIAKTVAAARKAGSDPTCYTVLASGRLAGRFHRRIQRLTAQAGLRFDEIRLNGEGSTLTFKLALIDDLIERLADVKLVEMWEDRHEHVDHFGQHLATKGVQFTVHHIREELKPVLCPTMPDRVAARHVVRSLTAALADTWP